MKVYKIACLAVALAFQVASAAQQGPISLAFSDTDVSQVLRAIGVRTGASIVYSGQDKLPITLNVVADSVEDAVRSTASAAGLSYRKVGHTYVCAKPDSLKQALQPFTFRDTFTPAGDPNEAARAVQEALPLTTVTVVGGKVVVNGIREDVSSAKRLIAAMAAGPRTVTNVLNLQYADPKAVEAMLRATYPAVRIASVQGKEQGGIMGSLVLSGPQPDVEAARATAIQVDVPNAGRLVPQGYAVYKIRYSSAPSLIAFLKGAAPEIECHAGPESYSPIPPDFHPISTSALGGTSSGSSGTSGGTSGGGSGSSGSGGGTYTEKDSAQDAYKATDRAKTIVLRGPEGAVTAAVKLLERVDVKPQQVAVEVRVIDTTPEVASNLGLSFVDGTTGLNSWSPFSFTEDQTKKKVAGFGQFVRDPFSFSAVLNASIEHKETKVLASPNLLITDNDQANIFVGDTLRVLLSTGGGVGVTSTTTVQEFPIGIIMLLRPRINGDGNITMRIHPTVSSITSVSANGLPQTSEREADTTVVAHDGETIVLGGLIRDEDTKALAEVPILSQLPIVGELFKNRKRSRTRKEVLVLITTHIVKDGDPNPDPFGPRNVPVPDKKMP